MRLGQYLQKTQRILERPEQQQWFKRLEDTVKQGLAHYSALTETVRFKVWNEFNSRVRTEEIKAWYSEPEGDSLFQGTSVSSLTIPCVLPEPLEIDSITGLENIIADRYIQFHNKYVATVKNIIQENTDEWTSQGLYYGVVICSKVISQAFKLNLPQEDVLFNINGINVDPHEILSYSADIRRAYFQRCRENIDCFKGIDLEQRELESSLVLADISKPKISRYKDHIMLAPIRCNEIAAIMSEQIRDLIIRKSAGQLRPKGLSIVITDTDTPYTYHKIMGYSTGNLSPILPGLTVLGSSGTIDAYRWLYTYRVSLISQKIQKGSLFSEAHERFMPFVFFGVLVWRDAEILLDMDCLSMLRYRGNISPDLEFAYLLPDLCAERSNDASSFCWEDFRARHLV